jgi:DNA replication and repair protein RecF
VRLLSLYVDALRNLREVSIEPHARLTAFLGDNGVGKTNLLEAVHLAAALRPLRSVERARDLIRFDAERGIVQGKFDLDGPLPVEVQLLPRGRKATLAGKQVRDLSEVARRIGVVAFTPDDLEIVRGGPDRRRRAIDRFAFQLEPAFAETARSYERALERRNRLLKAHIVDAAQLDAYTAPLVEAGAALLIARARALRSWAPEFAEFIRAVTDEKVQADLTYQTALTDEDPADADARALAARFEEKLASQADAERQRRTTLAGPHLDDVRIGIGEKRARRVASQGEARAIVLALKLAEVRLTTAARQSAPLFLLDDVAGELDPHKAACLFRTARETDAQVFVTATHAEVLPALDDARVYHLDAGRLSER